MTTATPLRTPSGTTTPARPADDPQTRPNVVPGTPDEDQPPGPVAPNPSPEPGPETGPSPEEAEELEEAE